MKETINDRYSLELNQRALFNHKIVIIIAIIFNPLWGIVDYFNLNSHFKDFFKMRILITFLTIIVFLLRKKLADKPQWIVLIPFIGLSLQNAYMYNTLVVDEFKNHTFAYIILFIGAGMFIIWDILYSIIVLILNILFNIIFFNFFGKLSLNEFVLNGGFLTFSIALFSVFLVHSRMISIKKEIKIKIKLHESNDELICKNTLIEQQKNDILASIQYALRIQEDILPKTKEIDKILNDYFILYKPKDIISGDFYWIKEIVTTPKQGESEKVVVVAAADCTGHGVPGAMMSVIGSTILNQSIKNEEVNSPSEALVFLNNQLNKNISCINDGMDISLIAINFCTLKLQFSGANNSIYIVRNKNIFELKADKFSIGRDIDFEKKFTNNIFQLEKNDVIYLFTDGYADQFGGERQSSGGKKFKYKQLKEKFIEISMLSMEEQKERLFEIFSNWKGNLEQVDDILIIGIRI